MSFSDDLEREPAPRLDHRFLSSKSAVIRATFRPPRILFEQIRLPRLLAVHGIDVLLNPGFTAPLLARCPQVTVFHDLQHKKHPEYFRALDLPFWNMLLAGSDLLAGRLGDARPPTLFPPSGPAAQRYTAQRCTA